MVTDKKTRAYWRAYRNANLEKVRESARKSQAKRREKAIEEGLCHVCCRRPAREGMTTCQVCSDRQKRWRETKKPKQHVPTQGKHKVSEFYVWLEDGQVVRVEHMGLKVKPYKFVVDKGGFVPALPCAYSTLKNLIYEGALKYEYIVEDYIVEGNE